jgi:hypothetical protein
MLPLPVGLRSENAAHRIAVEWDSDGRRMDGVYVPRRDTSSRFNTYAGGRLFPGQQHLAHFQVNEVDDNYSVALDSDDGLVHVSIDGRLSDRLPSTSLFRSLGEASTFFEDGAIGYSATTDPHRHDGIELSCTNWHVEPLAVSHVESSFFKDRDNFPPGSAVFDCALLMRNIQHQWLSREEICCPPNIVKPPSPHR